MLIWLAATIGMFIVAVLLVAAGLWLNAAGKRRETNSPELLPADVSAGGQASAAAEPLSRPDPRQRLTGFNLGCLLLFGLVWTGISLLGTVFSALWFIQEWQTYKVLTDTGVVTEATITSRRIDSDSEGDTHYVTYQYTAPLPQGDRHQFSREEQVNSREYHDMPPEARVAVLYNPADPGTARLQAGYGPPFFGLFMSCFVGLFLLVGLVLLIWGGSAIWQAVSLALNGQTAPGLITDRWVEADSDGDSYCVAYRFEIPQADGLTRQVDRAEYNYTAYQKYNPGDPVQVHYSPSNPDVCWLKL